MFSCSLIVLPSSAGGPQPNVCAFMSRVRFERRVPSNERVSRNRTRLRNRCSDDSTASISPSSTRLSVPPVRGVHQRGDAGPPKRRYTEQRPSIFVAADLILPDLREYVISKILRCLSLAPMPSVHH